ncbi:MAG: hypothetical protein NXI31_24630 [bacterium]|nr:hypothetical protein [bacterium]
MQNELGRDLTVLALVSDPRRMQTLISALRDHAIGVDVVTALSDARSTFFASGGHDCLVVGPDVPPGLADRVVRSLRAVDPELRSATFGPGERADEARAHTAKLTGFHPGSRAGAGALLRFLAGIDR